MHLRAAWLRPCGAAGCPCEAYQDTPLPKGGKTISLGMGEGEVCIGSDVDNLTGNSHRPAVRGKDGRCFICEPDSGADVPRNQLADAARSMLREVAHPEPCIWPAVKCTCPPEARPPYIVTFAVDGGDSFALTLPGEFSAKTVDGHLAIYRTGSPVLGIIQIETFPRKRSHGADDSEHEG